MSKEATDLVLGLAAFEQAEYAEATARKTTPAADVEGASASGAQTPAAEHRQERCPGGPVRSAAGAPTWAPVDSDTGDLLDLLANEHPAIPSEAAEWEHFKKVLAEAAKATGYIDQNAVRPLLRGEVKPQRVGAFYHRAAKSGLIAWDGKSWHESDDREGKNGGKPTKVWTWIGATS